MESEVLAVLETELVSADENPSTALKGRGKRKKGERKREISWWKVQEGNEEEEMGNELERTKRRWEGTNGGDVVSGDLDGHSER